MELRKKRLDDVDEEKRKKDQIDREQGPRAAG